MYPKPIEELSDHERLLKEGHIFRVNLKDRINTINKIDPMSTLYTPPDPKDGWNSMQLTKILIALVALLVIGLGIYHINKNIVTLIRQNGEIIRLLTKQQ